VEKANIVGHVLRAAPLSGDGIGDLYIAVFGKDPKGVDPGEPVAFVRISGADFSKDETSVEYSIEVPASPNPVYVLAIFDDDGSGIEPTPGPGDLVSLGSEKTPSIVVFHTEPLDLVLSVAL
jgi:hypothetical protein